MTSGTSPPPPCFIGRTSDGASAKSLIISHRVKQALAIYRKRGSSTALKGYGLQIILVFTFITAARSWRIFFAQSPTASIIRRRRENKTRTNTVTHDGRTEKKKCSHWRQEGENRGEKGWGPKDAAQLQGTQTNFEANSGQMKEEKEKAPRRAGQTAGPSRI